MKKLILSLVIVVALQAAAQNKVVAKISGFKNNAGVCRVCLYNNAASFNGEGGQPYQCLELPVVNKTTEAVFDKVPPGQYAVFVLHDANRNNKMDKNFLGIPKEGYGASRNKLPFAAAPGYEENKFSVNPNTITQLKIKLRNI